MHLLDILSFEIKEMNKCHLRSALSDDYNHRAMVFVTRDIVTGADMFTRVSRLIARFARSTRRTRHGITLGTRAVHIKIISKLYFSLLNKTEENTVIFNDFL